MNRDEASPSTDVAALQARLAIAEAERDAAVADAAAARARASDDQAMIAHLKLEIAKLKRQQHGQTSERSARLRRRTQGRDGGREDDAGHGVHPQKARAQALPRASAA